MKLTTIAFTLSALLGLTLWGLGRGQRAEASGAVNAPATFNVAAGDVAGLIAAINAANDETNHPGPDTINLGCGTYTLTERSDPYNYYGFNGLPVITSDITIEGNGAIIERSATAPAFRLLAVAKQDPATGEALQTPGALTLNNVWLMGGLARGGNGGSRMELGSTQGGGGAGLGGAILNQGALTILNSALSANTAQGGGGGQSPFPTNTPGPAGGGGLGGDGGATVRSRHGCAGGGGFGGRGGIGSQDGLGGGEGGGRTADGATPGGRVGVGASGGSLEGGDGGNERAAGNSGQFGGGGGGCGGNGAGGAGGIGGGGGGGSNADGGRGGFGGGGGGGFPSTNSGSGGAGGFGGGGGGGYRLNSIGGEGGFGGGAGSGANTIDPQGGGGGGAGMGGAVFNDGGTVLITNSTISGNSALGGTAGNGALAGQGLGGGIFARNGAVTIDHATFNLNTAEQGGGALYLLGDGAPVYIDGARTLIRQGDSAAVNYSVMDTILANSTGASDAFVNTINSGAAMPGANNNNLVEVNGADANGFPAASIVSSADPMLGELGVPANCMPGSCVAPLHSPLPGSPALATSIGAYKECNQSPVATCQNVTVSAGASCSADASIDNGSFDPDSGDTITITQSPAGPYPLGSTNVTLTVTDSQGLSSSCSAVVTVVNSAPPSLGNYPSATVIAGGGANITPDSPPSDNSSISSVAVIAPGFTGTATVDTATGVVSISNAGPIGSFLVTVTVTDNCGAQTTRDFTLTVAANTCGITVNPATLPQPYVGLPYGWIVSATPFGSYTFSVSEGELPPGLQLVTALGVNSIVGLPTTPGTYSFTIKAKKNGAACEAMRRYTLTIPATVAPILECVQRNSNGSYTARFGYDNTTGVAVTIPVGANNYFTPGAQNRGQVTVFNPGRVTNAFSVTFNANGGNLGVWILKGPDGVTRPVNITTTSLVCQ